MKPAVATAVATQIHASLQEPWFSNIIEACVAKFMCPSSSGDSAMTGNSQNSSSSSDNAAAAAAAAAPTTVAATSSGSVVDLDALCSWDVPCPVCGLNTFANEKVYYDHIGAIGKNRFKSGNVKLKCVMRSNDPHHNVLLQPYLNPRQSYYDSVLDFVNAMRALLNPGSKRVYRPGGTGNNVRVRAFINALLQKRVAVASAHVDDMWGDIGVSPDFLTRQ
jgi:hypothetical protein